MKTQESFTFVLTKAPNKNGQYNPTEIIPGTCEMYDEEQERTRICCYIPGQTTIWADEIKNYEDVKKNTKSIVITNGVKVIQKRENLLLQYMRNVGYNQSNKEANASGTTLFKEINRENDAKTAFLHNKEKDNAVYFVNNEKIEDVRSYALAIAKNVSEYNHVQTMSEYELRLAMRRMAEKEPKKFLEGMKEVATKNKVIIIKAIYKDVIKIDTGQTTLTWSNGGKLIEAPKGMNVIEYFSKACMDSPTHEKSFRTMIEILKDPSASFQGEKPKTNEGSAEKGESSNNEEIEALINKALDTGVITCGQNGLWYKYKVGKWKTRKDIVDMFSKFEDKLEELKQEIS